MLTRDKPFHTFDGPQKPFSFVCVNCVLKVLLMRNSFQIIQLIVSAIKVFVVYFQSILNAPVKRFPHHSMHAAPSVFGVFAKACNKIMLQQLRFNKPVSSRSSPRLALFDRMRRGYASAQKSSNLLKGSAMLKHLFSFGNFGGVKRFTSGNAAHVSEVANFVQTFKIQNWFPRFHSLTPFNVNGSIA